MLLLLSIGVGIGGLEGGTKKPKELMSENLTFPSIILTV